MIMTNDIVSQLKLLENKGVHNFSLGSLYCYSYLSLALQKKCVFFNGRILSLLMFGKVKTYVFEYDERDRDELLAFQKKGPLYSLEKIPFSQESRFEEIAYDLVVVFDPKSYSCAKKRYQRIKYPFVWLDFQKAEISGITEENFSEVALFHEKWRAFKMSCKKTYKIMFPQRRYLQCCEYALRDKEIYLSFVLKIKDEIQAVRVVNIQDEQAFDLAFFSNTWSAPSQLSNYFDIYVLSVLFREKNIKIFNCGASLNKDLKTFKTHYPYFTVNSFKYSMLKKEIIQEEKEKKTGFGFF